MEKGKKKESLLIDAILDDEDKDILSDEEEMKSSDTKDNKPIL